MINNLSVVVSIKSKQTLIAHHRGGQGCLVVLIWRVFRYGCEQKIAMVLTGAHRYNHQTMSANAVVDSVTKYSTTLTWSCRAVKEVEYLLTKAKVDPNDELDRCSRI